MKLFKFLDKILHTNKLILKDGDYLFFVFPNEIRIEELEQISHAIKSNFPLLANRIGLLWGDIKMYVIHEEKSDA